jgi:hypothetical protein
MGKLTDTSPEADRILTEVYRKMPIGRKWLLLAEDYRCARILHAAGVRQSNPAATPFDIHKAWLAMHLGNRPAEIMESAAMNPMLDNLQVVRKVASILDQLAIPYALGGSMASSVHGMNRYTRDADLSAEPFPGKEERFAACFGPDYYLSVQAIEDAIRRRSSFNIINTSTGFKIDIFIRKDRPFELSAMQRRISVVLPDLPEQPMTLITPEDAILFKLEWFRLGNEALDQQWKDVLGILKVQAGKLDEAYLDHWAAELKVSDLLAKARQELQH